MRADEVRGKHRSQVCESARSRHAPRHFSNLYQTQLLSGAATPVKSCQTAQSAINGCIYPTSATGLTLNDGAEVAAAATASPVTATDWNRERSSSSLLLLLLSPLLPMSRISADQSAARLRRHPLLNRAMLVTSATLRVVNHTRTFEQKKISTWRSARVDNVQAAAPTSINAYRLRNLEGEPECAGLRARVAITLLDLCDRCTLDELALVWRFPERFALSRSLLVRCSHCGLQALSVRAPALIPHSHFKEDGSRTREGALPSFDADFKSARDPFCLAPQPRSLRGDA